MRGALLVGYRGCVPTKIGSYVPPLTVGKWLMAVSIPLTAGWIAAAVASKTDMFGGPFWIFLVPLIVGIGLSIWNPVLTSFSLQHGMLRVRRSAAKHSISQVKLDLGLSRDVVLEELASGVACFLLFWALISI